MGYPVEYVLWKGHRPKKKSKVQWYLLGKKKCVLFSGLKESPCLGSVVFSSYKNDFFLFSLLFPMGLWWMIFCCSPFMVVRWIRYFSHEMVVSEADDFINILLILEVCVRSCVIQKRTELITIVPFWITHYQRTLYKRDFQNLNFELFLLKKP